MPSKVRTSPGRHQLDRRASALIEAGAGADDDLLSTRELADWLGMSNLWLELGRMHGYGPRYIRIGTRRIRYRRADVLTWLRERTFSRTDEYQKRVASPKATKATAGAARA